MFKQIVFSVVAVAFVSQAHAVPGREGKEGGRARAEVAKDEAAKAKEAGGARSSKELIRAGASKRLDKIFGTSLAAKDKEALLDLAISDKLVAKALSELAKSKQAGNNALIDDAQVGALLSLSKIADLNNRIKESTETSDKLTSTERTVYNLVVQVPSKARKDWAADDKAVAAEAIKIFGDEARSGSLDQALKTMTEKMANHPDKKLRATINEEAIKKFCS